MAPYVGRVIGMLIFPFKTVVLVVIEIYLHSSMK